MIQLTAHMRILVATAPVDFRKGIDGLARLCRETLGRDPFSGGLFVFANKRRKAVKILVYDGQGFWLCQKRLSQGRFPWWPGPWAGTSQALQAHQLAVLLSGGNPEAARGVGPWRRVDGGP
jgi:transposase